MLDRELPFDVEEFSGLDEVLWWAGWHPRQLSWLGAGLGLLAGTALGVLDGGALILGLVLLGLGIRHRRFYNVEMAIALVVGVAVYVVGADAALEAAGSLGLRIDPLLGFLSDVAGGFLAAFALLGVDLGVEEPVTVIFRRLYQVFGLGAAGALLVAPLWFVGVVHVTTSYNGRYREYDDRLEEKGRELLGPDGDWDPDRFYNLTYGLGSVPLLTPNKQYYVTNLYIGDHAIGVHADSTIDMVADEIEVSTSTRQLYYDQVASVDYTDPYLEVKMSDGERFRFISTTEPGELLEDVKASLQQYKSL